MEVRDDALVKVVHLLEMVSNWRAFLNDLQNVDADRLRRHERTGRPLGQEALRRAFRGGIKPHSSPEKTWTEEADRRVSSTVARIHADDREPRSIGLVGTEAASTAEKKSR